jgi:hypothetical protein
MVIAILSQIATVKAIYFLLDAYNVLSCIASANPRASEKRLVVEVHLLKEILQRLGAILGHVPGTEYQVDCMTKMSPNQAGWEVDFSKITWMQVSGV